MIQKVTAGPAPLTGKQRSFLRALAHPLKPVVQIGHGGLSDAVLAAIDGALSTHELIKVRITGQEEVDVDELAQEVEAGTRSTVAQVIGKTLVVYRARKKDPVIVLPKASDKPSKTAKASK
ncbi:MAG TPA: ribosome assembly RNA-binding protein YhbY [Polyangiaceae bacterium]|nr:ribosome assembly RNA-binding protein YhbY [Polyangiaceae bacterium]